MKQQHCRLLFDDCFCTFSDRMEVPRENQVEKGEEEDLKIARFNDVEEMREGQASPRRRVDDVWERKVWFRYKSLK